MSKQQTREELIQIVLIERERCARLVEEYTCTTANLKALAEQIRNPEPPDAKS